MLLRTGHNLTRQGPSNKACGSRNMKFQCDGDHWYPPPGADCRVCRASIARRTFSLTTRRTHCPSHRLMSPALAKVKDSILAASPKMAVSMHTARPDKGTVSAGSPRHSDRISRRDALITEPPERRYAECTRVSFVSACGCAVIPWCVLLHRGVAEIRFETSLHPVNRHTIP